MTLLNVSNDRDHLVLVAVRHVFTCKITLAVRMEL